MKEVLVIAACTGNVSEQEYEECLEAIEDGKEEAAGG